MEPSEAVDLIATLPEGSLYRASRLRHGELTEMERLALDVIDELRRFEQLFATGTTEGAIRAVRPETLRDAERRRESARAASRAIEETEWVSADG